jgi:hypothetical protein
MPTARELLEQADALMRRNRGNRGDDVSGGDESIPVLTESIENALGGPSLRGPLTRERAGAGLQAPSPAVEDAGGSDVAANAPDADEPPLLTDAVEEVAVELLPMPGGNSDEDAAPWLGPDTIDPALHSITGPSPDTVGTVPPMTLRAVPPSHEPSPSALEAELDESIATRTLRAAGSAPTPPPAGSMPAESVAATGTSEEERWHALAEQISMQVLQRLDLFVDTGLKVQLAAHLQPIVARAGTELVEAINDHVGQLVRSYIAEAIEREIAQWRQGQR